MSRSAFFGSRSAFFFQKFHKKKKKKKKKKIFFQNRFKNIITFPKMHADNFLEIFSIVKTSYAFWSWICLWRFLTKLGNSQYEILAEGRNPCRRQGSFLISLINPYSLEVLAVGSSIPPDGIDFFFSKKKL